jgi:hypothetical protein
VLSATAGGTSCSGDEDHHGNAPGPLHHRIIG